jgi:cell division transport system permease protein
MIKFAIQHFFRNFGLSVITIIILFLTLISVNVFIGFNYVTDEVVSMVQEKIDISLYFDKEVSSEEIIHVQDYLEKLEYVKSIALLEKEDVLLKFQETHANNEEMLASLDEVKDNPFGAMLVVKVNTMDDYNYVINALEGEEFERLIERRSYENHEEAIDKIESISENVTYAIVVFTLMFILISILIVYNTVKVMIYNHREEIRIMKLVGASDRFVRWPFVLEGMINVFIAMILVMLVVYPFLLQVFQLYFGSFNIDIMGYFRENFLVIFGIQFLAALLLNMISSSLAVGKHLNK